MFLTWLLSVIVGNLPIKSNTYGPRPMVATLALLSTMKKLRAVLWAQFEAGAARRLSEALSYFWHGETFSLSQTRLARVKV